MIVIAIAGLTLFARPDCPMRLRYGRFKRDMSPVVRDAYDKALVALRFRHDLLIEENDERGRLEIAAN